MTRLRVPVIALVVTLAATAHGTEPSMTVDYALTTIDSVPTSLQLDVVFTDHADALANLAMIAADPGTDTGIRLRAIDALTNYCGSPCVDGDMAHLALTGLITTNADVVSGPGIVLLRGAIEAVGPQRVATDLAILVPLLDHGSRDIRAATAHALRDLCNTQAINPLRIRYGNESIDQVRLAITDALNVLGQPSSCP